MKVSMFLDTHYEGKSIKEKKSIYHRKFLLMEITRFKLKALHVYAHCSFVNIFI